MNPAELFEAIVKHEDPKQLKGSIDAYVQTITHPLRAAVVLQCLEAGYTYINMTKDLAGVNPNSAKFILEDMERKGIVERISRRRVMAENREFITFLSEHRRVPGYHIGKIIFFRLTETAKKLFSIPDAVRRLSEVVSSKVRRRIRGWKRAIANTRERLRALYIETQRKKEQVVRILIDKLRRGLDHEASVIAQHWAKEFSTSPTQLMKRARSALKY
ncbi:hypothetical protein [Candidatus Pyrohabitans sp.]